MLPYVIAYNFIFDDFMLEKGCKVWSFDPSMEPGDYKRGPNHEFRHIGIGATNAQWRVQGVAMRKVSISINMSH